MQSLYFYRVSKRDKTGTEKTSILDAELLLNRVIRDTLNEK